VNVSSMTDKELQAESDRLLANIRRLNHGARTAADMAQVRLLLDQARLVDAEIRRRAGNAQGWWQIIKGTATGTAHQISSTAASVTAGVGAVGMVAVLAAILFVMNKK